MDKFKLVSDYKPSGDQPEAISALVNGVNWGLREQTLLGVTGSGKTFTMASVIEKLNRPTLVLAHNKTLAAQLCSEFREFFPENAVEYFISYYDYYQPEAYIAHTDTYIEKDASVNEEIDRLRHSATSALFERRDVIVVSSVSCLYGLGDPIDYKSMVISLRVGQEYPLDNVLKKLTEIRYERNDLDFSRNKFRLRGDTLEIYPAYWSGRAIRVEFFGDEVDRISEINAVSGIAERYVDHVAIYPASHYVASKEKLQRAMLEIQRECDDQVAFFRAHDKLIEAQRIAQRTAYDLEMLTEIGFCNGIENYSRVIQGRAPGTPPTTLLDYFPKDYLMFIDESHVTLPQCRAMYAGDRSRKDALVNYGFRLPSAYDNRPLNFTEFDRKINQVIYVSATPAEYELSRAGQVAEQDVVIVISNSGNTAELKQTVTTLKQNRAVIIAVCGNTDSWLYANSDAQLYAHVEQEGDRLNKPPRASILVELLVLQSLSVLLQYRKNITGKDYLKWHPGGSLGERTRREEQQ